MRFPPKLVRLWPPVASALLLLAAFPPFNLFLLVFAALAPWLANLATLNGKQAFKSGYLFGLVYYGGQFVWLAQFVHAWTGSPALSLVPPIAGTLIGALYFALAGWLIRMCAVKSLWWAVPLVWSGVEAGRSLIPGLAFPWGLIHTPLWGYASLIQLSAFGSAYLVSAWIILANLVLMFLLQKADIQRVRMYGIPFLVLLMAGFVRYQTPITGEPKRILIGQLGVDMAFQEPEEEARQVREAASALVMDCRDIQADLLVFPEGMVRPDAGWPPRVEFPLPENMPVLFGGQRGVSPTYQSAIGFDGTWKYADKKRLVIFGEYVPFRNQLPFLQNFSLPSGDLTPSDRTQSVRLGTLNIGPLLCFEGLFFDTAREQVQNGAQVLAVMSIDDWYLQTWAPEQLAAASVFRAVESDLPLVRAAALGISQVVDQRGNVLNRAQIGERKLLEANVLVPPKSDAPVSVILFPFAALLSLILPLVLGRKPKVPEPNP